MHNLLHNEAEICGLTITQTAAPAGYLVPATALPEPFASTSLRNMAEDLAAEVRAFLAGITPAGRPDAILTASGSIALADCEAYDDPAVAFRDGTVLHAVKLPAEAIPVRERVSVFVAGGGTSGIQTLEALRDRGVSAAMAELCAMPGGTRNLGMVMGYWHGHKTGRNAALDVIAGEAEKAYKISSNGANILTQNAALAPMEEHFYFNTVVCGAIRDGRAVKSLILCDGGGLFRADADIFVDATGDAAAAYLAGAAYMHGDPRDGNVQTYSQWGENLWRSGSFLENRYHGDHDIIDLDSWEDCLRGMYLGQHDNSDIRYSPLLTVREGRRVIGDYVLTMDDIWDETIFDDTVAVTLTPFDTHGKGSALYCDMGLTSLDGKELRARIPWRCYIARDLDNLLITAKAYSATRDANSIGRMNADLRHAGYAVGLGAAEAILTKKSVRAIDLAPVQAELKAQGILPEWTFEPLEIPATEKLCELANAGDAEAILVLYRTTDPARIAEIAAMWEKHPEDPLTLRLASWHSLPGATEAAAAKLCALMDANPGGKIENYALARQLAASLTHADALPAELLAPVIARACAGGDVFYPPTHRYYAKIYGYDRVDGWKVPHFGMLYLLAQAAERHADASLAAPLEALLAKQYIGGYVLRGGEAPEAPFTDHGISPIFCALLELRIAAAAARCGSDRGAALLRDYAEEDRSILRKFAKKELAAVTAAGGICPCTEPLTLR